MWKLYFTKDAQKDAKRLASAGLKAKAEQLLAVIQQNPFQNPPPYEKLVGNQAGFCSRRINIQHRLIYEVIDSEQAIRVTALWGHYE